MSEIALIVAASENNAIGINNQLPWRLSADLKYFKHLTTGHTIIMGRKTYDSIGKPLPNRENIVITRNKHFEIDGVIVVNSIDEAIKYAQNNKREKIYIIGGDSIYKQSISLANTIYLTRVHTTIQDADAFFPKLHQTVWQQISIEHHKADDKNEYDYSFEVYARV